ncbi:MAG: hypothetical protein WC241_03595 [Candidatus Paceibacterota bacterium]|jgi:hypothetical protein
MDFILKNKKFEKVMLLISVVTFLWISIFGLVYHMNQMRPEVSNNSCLFSAYSNGECAMNISEHITFWQEMFTSTPQNIAGFMDAIILIISLAILIIFYRDNLSLSSKRIASRFRLYIKQHPQINLFNYLGEVFSSGILNTKKYKLATI